MAQRFRKKPVVVEAMQVAQDPRPIIAWAFDLKGKSRVRFEHEHTVAGPGRGLTRYADVLVVSTLLGEMVAELGDWIIRGVKGEFYPCKPDIFAAIYEEVDR